MAKTRLGVLFSGGGRTVENLALRCADGSIDAEIVVAIASHAECGGVRRCEKLGLRTEVVDYKEHGGELSSRIVAILEDVGIDYILLAGFIRFFEYPASYEGRVVNIHPALLPAFGGQGFYGDRVHRAVIESGVKFSGCTVHFVSREYDKGPIIVQRIVPVANDDTPDTLAARVFEQECVAYPDAVRLLITGELEAEGQRVRIRKSV